MAWRLRIRKFHLAVAEGNESDEETAQIFGGSDFAEIRCVGRFRRTSLPPAAGLSVQTN